MVCVFKIIVLTLQFTYNAPNDGPDGDEVIVVEEVDHAEEDGVVGLVPAILITPGVHIGHPRQHPVTGECLSPHCFRAGPAGYPDLVSAQD